MIVNINTQSRDVPTQIGARFAVTWGNSKDLLLPLGWRELPDDYPPIADGYVRCSGPTAVDLDGENGTWQVYDRLRSVHT